MLLFFNFNVSIYIIPFNKHYEQRNSVSKGILLLLLLLLTGSESPPGTPINHDVIMRRRVYTALLGP